MLTFHTTASKDTEVNVTGLLVGIVNENPSSIAKV